MVNHRRLLTVKQLAESSPAFSEASLRWLIFNAKQNGFETVVLRVGRRVLIDLDRFEEWLSGTQQSESA
jgi:hypothetical protein